MRTILIIGLFFLFISSYSQKNKIDILKEKADSASGQKKVKFFNHIAGYYIFNNIDSTKLYVKKSLKLCQENHFDSLELECYNIKGVMHSVSGNSDSAEYYFLKTYKLSIERNYSTYTRFSINNMGMFYYNKGDYNKALDYFFKALKLAEQNKTNTKSYANPLNNIGLVYQKMKQYDKAFEYYYKATIIREKYNIEEDLPISYNNLGICYSEMDKEDSAIYYFNKAIKFAKINADKDEEAHAYSSLGTIYFENGDYKKAEKYYLRAIEENKTSVAIEITSNNNLIGIYFALKQYEKGIEYGKTTLELVKAYTQSKTPYGYETYKLLSLNFAGIGSTDSALHYIGLYKKQVDSLFSEENAKAINDLEVAYETEKKEADNQRLAKENAISEIKILNRNRWIIIILSSLLILVFLNMYISQRKKRKAQAEKDAAIIEEREKGMSAIIEAQEDERKRVAKELHDGIGQQISALNFNIQSLASKANEITPNLSNEFSKIKTMNRDIGEEIRNISHRMMPRALTEFGLINAIEDMTEKSFSHSNIKCSFEHHNMNNRLPQNIEIGLYRITQELVNNIIKHSEATHVDIQLVKNDGHCILMVSDNGKGFDKINSNGIGIQNINSRLNALNGELNFESEVSNGTTAIVKIKL
jgi:signal transduction histidine kinase/Flp pilus assembly protein TadD